VLMDQSAKKIRQQIRRWGYARWIEWCASRRARPTTGPIRLLPFIETHADTMEKAEPVAVTFMSKIYLK